MIRIYKGNNVSNTTCLNCRSNTTVNVVDGDKREEVLVHEIGCTNPNAQIVEKDFSTVSHLPRTLDETVAYIESLWEFEEDKRGMYDIIKDVKEKWKDG